MLPIVWTPEFNIGIKIIDEQHKKLVDTINMLYNAISEGKGRSVLTEVFDNLTEYTTAHFSTEEDLMIKYSYPDYEEHKNEHNRCIAKVSDFKKRFDQGKPGIAADTAAFLSDWFHTHLLEMDQKYKPFLRR